MWGSNLSIVGFVTVIFSLFVTVGSDFHNKDGLRPEIGFVNTDFVLAEEVIEEILRNLEK